MAASRWRLLIGLIAGMTLSACDEVGAPQSAVSQSVSVSNPAALSTGAQLAAVCSGCHTGETTAFASLAGLSAQEIQSKLSAYVEDEAGTTVMHRIARGYSETEIEAVATYLGLEEAAP